MWCQLGATEFARLLGSSVGECVELLSGITYDFRYQHLDKAGRDRLVISILGRIDSLDLSLAGPEGKGRWEKGWQENLGNFIAKSYVLEELIPKYIRPGQPKRLFGDYITPQDLHFELNFYTLLSRWLFGKYLADVDAIYEFGCGPAHNIAALAKMFPEKEIHGLDWVSAPRQIIGLMANKHGYKVSGHLFDMFAPDENLAVKPNSAFLSIGSFEQLGANFETFLQFAIRKAPAIFVQVECFLELCDQNNLSDFLAVKHNLQRNYLRGYLARLRELEAEGKIQIIKAHKVECCGLYYDGYSYVIWKPTMS